MNTYKILQVIVAITATGLLCGMEVSEKESCSEEESCLKLSMIEQKLILREVERQGKEHILIEVCKKKEYPPLTWNQKRQVYSRKIPAVLKIKEIFYKTDIDKDPLTKHIFDVIQEIETNEGYRPEHDYGSDIDYDPMNILGLRTDYKWIKNNDNDDLSAVRIRSYFKARPYDQKALENVINSYNQ